MSGAGAGCRHLGAGAAAVLVTIAVAAPGASAQDDRAWPGRLTVDVGAGLAGSYPVGSSRATLTGNVVPQGDRVTLFDSEVGLRAARAFEVRAGWRLREAAAIEAELSYARPAIRVRITGDADGVPALDFANSRLEQYAIGGSLVVMPVRWGLAGGRIRPVVRAGVSYLRELHDGRAVVDEGRLYHLGGGLQYSWMRRPDGLVKGLVLRADARWRLREAGFELEDRRRPSGAASGGLQVRF